MDYNVRLVLEIGGRAGLRPAIALFYERMAADPWLGRWFEDVDLTEQARKLEDFLCTGVPGEPPFTGNFPLLAHSHMFVTQPMLKRRTRILASAIRDCGHPDELVHLWLKTDALWHSAVRKDRVDECRPNPAGKPVKVIGPDPGDG